MEKSELFFVSIFFKLGFFFSLSLSNSSLSQNSPTENVAAASVASAVAAVAAPLAPTLRHSSATPAAIEAKIIKGVSCACATANGRVERAQKTAWWIALAKKASLATSGR
jgi:hypothetical protein